ncbi:hypothetical protein ACROYT_G022774 [Oculina patagonica]
MLGHKISSTLVAKIEQLQEENEGSTKTQPEVLQRVERRLQDHKENTKVRAGRRTVSSFSNSAEEIAVIVASRELTRQRAALKS